MAESKNNNETNLQISRRQFCKTSAMFSLAAITAGSRAYAAGSDKIRVGLIGCGNRGRGGAMECAQSSEGVEIVAVADLFEIRAVAGDNNSIFPAQAVEGVNINSLQKYIVLDLVPGNITAFYAENNHLLGLDLRLIGKEVLRNSFRGGREE